jgi:hypothetical protein
VWRRRDAHVDELEAGDPLQESMEGALIQQPSMKRGHARPTLTSQSPPNAWTRGRWGI